MIRKKITPFRKMTGSGKIVQPHRSGQKDQPILMIGQNLVTSGKQRNNERMKKSISFLFALTLMLSFPHGARGQQSTTLVNQDKIIARVQAMGDGASVDQVMSEAYKATGANYYERIQLIAKRCHSIVT